DMKAVSRRGPLPLLIVLGASLLLVPGIPATAYPQATGELTAAFTCVISAWNAFDTDAARRCYDELAVAVWGGEPRPIDWEFERRASSPDPQTPRWPAAP